MRVRLAFTAVLVMVAGCGSDSATAPTSAQPLTHVVETEAFLFRSSEGESIEIDRQLAFHTWAQRELGVTAMGRITYNKYRSRAHMGDLIGVSNTNAWADPQRLAIHTIWAFDNHETVHLYATPLGFPVALLTEGLAVSMQTNPFAGDFVPRWNGTYVHDAARTLRQAGRLIPLDQLLQTSQLRTYDPNVVYPEAGSFVRFLIDAYGLERFKDLYARGTTNDPAGTVAANLSTVYGASVAALEADWWAVIERR